MANSVLRVCHIGKPWWTIIVIIFTITVNTLICTGSSRFCDALLRPLFNRAPTSSLGAESIGCYTLQLPSSLDTVLQSRPISQSSATGGPRCNLGLMYQPPFSKVGTVLKGHLNSRTFSRIDFGLNCNHMVGQTLLSCDIFFTVSKENKCTDSGDRLPGFEFWLLLDMWPGATCLTSLLLSIIFKNGNNNNNNISYSCCKQNALISIKYQAVALLKSYVVVRELNE